MTTDARGRLAAVHAKWDAERRDHEELKRQAAAEEAAEQLARQQQAERAALEAKRRDRETLEAYETLTPDQRAQFDQLTNPQRVARELAEQAMSKAIEKFNQENAAQREQELAATRQAGLNQVQRHRIIQEANQRADERAAAFKKMLEDRQLQAEQHDDPVYRVVTALPDDARQTMNELLNQRPHPMDVINQIKANDQQRAHQDRQLELYTAFLKELKEKNVRGWAWYHNTKLKYVNMGLDPNYSNQDVVNTFRT